MTTALTITDDNGGMLRVTSGVAQDVPMSDLAYRVISERNNYFYYGRVYAQRNDEIGLLAVLLQEIIPLALLSWEYRASIEYALSVIASVNLAASGDGGVDLDAVEADFIAAAGPYSQRKGISYEAWRAAGLEPRVLKAAGIGRGQ